MVATEKVVNVADAPSPSARLTDFSHGGRISLRDRATAESSVSDHSPRITAFLRASITRSRETERVGPFLASFSGDTGNPFLSYAIPDDDAEPTLADVAALNSAYLRHERVPRIEYVPALAPVVEGVLLDAGWQPENRLPLMVLAAGTSLDGDVPPGIQLVTPATDAEFVATAAAQNEAYGGPPEGPEAGTALRRTTERGGRVVLAQVADTAEPIGGGVFVAAHDGVTEIAAIGVRERFRRSGVATAMVRRLAQEAREAGATTVFLMAESPVEVRIYARIGFETIGEMLHISDPAGHRYGTGASDGVDTIQADGVSSTPPH